MILSHKHKFIFLKTRKTAGTSIEIALSRFCGEKDIITTISPQDEVTRQELSYRGPQNYRVSLAKYPPEERAHLERLFEKKNKVRYRNHISAEEIRALIGTKIWNEYFKFCFERNPWDKAISLYFWRTRFWRDHPSEPRPTLLEFLESENARGLSNFGIYSIDGDVAADYVGMYENLDSELERIAALLELPEKMSLPRAKGTFREDRRHYRDLMGDEERDLVAQVCAREIEHFGYNF